LLTKGKLVHVMSKTRVMIIQIIRIKWIDCMGKKITTIFKNVIYK